MCFALLSMIAFAIDHRIWMLRVRDVRLPKRYEVFGNGQRPPDQRHQRAFEQVVGLRRGNLCRGNNGHDEHDQHGRVAGCDEEEDILAPRKLKLIRGT